MAPHASLLAAIRVDGPLWVLELTGADASVLRYSAAAVASRSAGLFRRRVVSWGGEYSRALGDRNFSLQAVSARVRIADPDRTIAQLKAAGNMGAAIARGSAARILVGHPTLTPATYWYPDFVGVVESCDMSAPGVWEIGLRCADTALRTPVPHEQWRISSGDWPEAPADSIGRMAPWIVGIHDSTGRSGDGAVDLIRVAPGVYLSQAGLAADVRRVYVAGVLQATGWTRADVTRGGRCWTTVEFDTDPGIDDPGIRVSADVEGLTDAGDGSGALIEDPVDAIVHLLSAWAFNDWGSGAYPSSALVDATTAAVAKSYLQACGFGGRKVARRIAEQRTAIDLLAEWALGEGVWPYWTDAGTVGFAINDHRTSAYVTSPAARPGQVETSGRPLSVPYPVQQLADRAAASGLPDGVALSVYDPAAKVGGLPADLTVAMPWARRALE